MLRRVRVESVNEGTSLTLAGNSAADSRMKEDRQESWNHPSGVGLSCPGGGVAKHYCPWIDA